MRPLRRTLGRVPRGALHRPQNRAILLIHISEQPASADGRIAANDNARVRQVLAWPALERQAHTGRRDYALALIRWRDLTSPARFVAVNDNQSTDAADMLREIRPSEGELLRAVGWKVVGNERWAHTGKSVNTYEPAEEPEHVQTRHRACKIVDERVGDLLFRNGELVEWGLTAKGKPLKPIDRTADPKGGPTPKRSDAAIWAYLGLQPTTQNPLTASGVDRIQISAEGAGGNGTFYDPLPREAPSAADKSGRFGVEAGRVLLRSFGVDGGVPFDALPVAATKCQPSLISGPQWKGGVPGMKGTGPSATTTPDFGHRDAVRELQRTVTERRCRAALGKHAMVLDMATTDATAEEIGIAAGRKLEGAKRYGAHDIDRAIAAFIEVEKKFAA